MSTATPWQDMRVRVDEEAAELEEAGYVVTAREHLGNGIWRLEVTAPDDKTGIGDISLRINLPSSYPFMPPFVHCDGIELRHHQQPFNGHLCLIERSTQNWIPEWHLVGLLDNQLKRALAAGVAAPGEAVGEAEQGEPYSAYYTYSQNTALLIDMGEIVPDVGDSGPMEVSFVEAADPVPRFIGVVDEMRVGGVSVCPSDRLHAAFGSFEPRQLSGRWTMLESPPATDDPKEIWRLARETDGQSTKGVKGTAARHREIRAIGFPEEHTHDTTGTGWIFVVKDPGVVYANRRQRRSGGTGAKTPDVYTLMPVFRAGQADLAYRAPETHGLESKSVAVIGCGAIGSVLIEQLARAGVGEFHLVDGDKFEPGNLSRHTGSLDVSGLEKVYAISHRLREVSPYATVHPGAAAIGGTNPAGRGGSETDALTDLMKSVDMVVDASAEIGVQQYTSLLARAAGTTWVCVDGTAGIGGGRVVKIDTDADYCYSCFCWLTEDGVIPTPNAVDTGYVQPVGCSSPTFTGTGFDLSVIAAQGSRVIIGALLRGVEGGYPEDGYDAHVLQLRDDHGDICPPTWTGFHVTRHEACPYHQ